MMNLPEHTDCIQFSVRQNILLILLSIWLCFSFVFYLTKSPLPSVLPGVDPDTIKSKSTKNLFFMQTVYMVTVQMLFLFFEY